MNQLMDILHQIFTAIKHMRKIEYIVFFVILSVLVVLFYKFMHLAKSRSIKTLDLLYFVRGTDGSISPTKTMSYMTMLMVTYMDIQFVDHSNVIWAIGLHLLYILTLQGIVKAVDLVALKNGTTVSTSSTSTVSTVEATVVTPASPVTS